MRLDIEGPPHRNPDGQEVPCPHLHIYREGYGDKWAVPAPAGIYLDAGKFFPTFVAFMQHFNITPTPELQEGLY